MHQDPSPLWRRLAEAIAAHPWRMILAWVVILGVSIPSAAYLQDHLTPTRSIEGTESARVDALIAERFDRDTRQSGVLLVQGLRPVHEPDDMDVLKFLVQTVRGWEVVERASSINDIPRDFMVGRDGTGALVLVQFHPDVTARALAPLQEALAQEAAAQSADRDPPLALLWTGNFFLHSDVRKASQEGARQGELMALPLTLLLLLAIFGSIRAALSPVISAVVAVGVSIGFVGIITLVFAWSPSVLIQNVISLIGLALTIDYSLLTLNRFRRATEDGLEPPDALVTAASISAPTIALAGLSVLLGFAALLMVPIDEIRSIGVGGVLASVMAVVVATTLLPAVLALLAPRLARGRRGRGGAKGRAFFAAVTRAVCRRPAMFLLAAAIPLTLMALPIQGLKITAHNENWLPAEAPSTEGLNALIEMGRRGLTNEILVVAEAPEGDTFFSATGWAAAHAIYDRLAVLDKVDSVIALPKTMSAKLKPEILEGIPRKTLDPLLSPDNQVMLYRVIPDSGLDINQIDALVRDMRRLGPIGETRRPAPTILVGGTPASIVDYVDIVWRWMPYVIGLVILGAFLVLAVAFRTPVVAFKAVVLNLFSVGAAFGLATLVFIDGYGAGLIGIAAQVDGVFPAMPLIVFCAVFGVSMDYEVFLIARIAAARKTEDGETAAIVRGISETGMVITFAAAIMILVFGSFTATEFLPAKMLGFTLATAVFLDATIVRILMSPALMRLAGRWNWWPGG